MKRSLAKLVGNMSWLRNQWVLYIVFAMALVNLLSYLTLGDMRHTIIFVLIGFITSFFSKNMVVILIMAMGITNAMKILSAVFYGLRREGLEGMDDEEKENMDDMEDDKENMDDMDDDKENMDDMYDEKEGMDDMYDEKEGMDDLDEEEKKENMDDMEEEKKEKTESMSEIKKDGKELMKLQGKIEEGFSKIEPYMDKAERLLTRLEESMDTLSKKKMVSK